MGGLIELRSTGPKRNEEEVCVHFLPESVLRALKNSGRISCAPKSSSVSLVSGYTISKINNFFPLQNL